MTAVSPKPELETPAGWEGGAPDASSIASECQSWENGNAPQILRFPSCCPLPALSWRPHAAACVPCTCATWTHPALFGLPELRGTGCNSGISWSYRRAGLATKLPTCPRSLAWPLQPGDIFGDKASASICSTGPPSGQVGGERKPGSLCREESAQRDVDEMSRPQAESGKASWRQVP